MNYKLLFFQLILSIVYLSINLANSYYFMGTWNLNRTIGWEFDYTNFIFYKSIGNVLIIVLFALLLFSKIKKVKLNSILNYLILGFTMILAINNLVNKDLFFHHPIEIVSLSFLSFLMILIAIKLIRFPNFQN